MLTKQTNHCLLPTLPLPVLIGTQRSLSSKPNDRKTNADRDLVIPETDIHWLIESVVKVGLIVERDCPFIVLLLSFTSGLVSNELNERTVLFTTTPTVSRMFSTNTSLSIQSTMAYNELQSNQCLQERDIVTNESIHVFNH